MLFGTVPNRYAYGVSCRTRALLPVRHSSSDEFAPKNWVPHPL